MPSLKQTLLQMGKLQGLTEAKVKEAVKKRTGKDLEALNASEISTLVQAMARKMSSAETTRPKRSRPPAGQGQGPVQSSNKASAAPATPPASNQPADQG